MKYLVCFICLVSVAILSINLAELRKNYPLANENSQIAQKMHAALASTTKDDKAILIAYKGAFSTLVAKHSKAIKDKKNYFKEGVQLIELAVKQDPKNIEIRYLRLSVQENSPKLLKYKTAIQIDKQFILDHYSLETSQEIKALIKTFALQSTAFNQAERQLF